MIYMWNLLEVNDLNIYFAVYCFLIVFNLGSSITNHGEPRKGNENFFLTLFSSILSFYLVYNAIKCGF